MKQNLILKKLKLLQSEKVNSKFWNITWEQGIFLSNLIDLKQPKRILEIGTSNGFSTLFLALNLDKLSIIDTIDINSQRLKLAKQNFDYSNLTNINIYNGNVFKVIEKLKTNKYDFLFIDAAHAFYIDLLTKIQELNFLNNDFTIIFDNITTHKHLKKFTNFAKKHYDTQYLNIGGGFLMLKNKK